VVIFISVNTELITKNAVLIQDSVMAYMDLLKVATALPGTSLNLCTTGE
jgi:hypothetical protein